MYVPVFELKCLPNVFQLPVDANNVNFVYYGKTWMDLVCW